MTDSTPTYEITLTSLSNGGVAFGRLPDGRALFVPYALPEETVRVRLTEEKKTYARAELLEVLTPSPKRIAPRCPHFTVCGGCHFQHMAYEDQLAAKSDILRDQLERMAKIADPPLQPIVPAPQPWNYRNHLQFHLTGEGKLGFQAARSHQVVPISECHLPEATLDALWPLLEFEADTGIERVSLRLGAEDELMLILEGQDPDPPAFNLDMPIASVYVGPEGPKVLADSHRMSIDVMGRAFQVSAESFFQVNTPLAAAMVEHLLENLPLSPDAVVLDVYCGVGLFSVFLAQRVGRLIGIEASPSAAEDFVVNLDEFENVELYEDKAESVLPTLDVQPDIVVVDPPRAGLAKRALSAILKLAPPVLAYVSCDPATLSRDARRLVEGGYRLVKITPFDLFPQTYHIESVSFWEKT